MALSRDSILKHSGVFTTREVHVPAWADANGDDVVLVRGMTVREFEVNQSSVGKDEGKATAALLARCVLEPSGARLFEDRDIDAIAELGLAEVNRIAKVVVELSGLADDEAEDKAEAGDGKDTQGGAEPGKPQPESSAANGSSSRPISLAGSGSA